MSHLFLYHVFFGLLVAIGLWMLVSGLAGLFRANESHERMASFLGEKGNRQLIISDLPPLAQRLLAQPLADIGFFLFRNQDQLSLENRLRRSGWRYKSVGDYYGSKIATAVGFFAIGAVCAVLLGLPPLLVPCVAVGAGLLGLYKPDETLKNVTNERRDALYREMAWTLDRLATVMKTGEALQSTLTRITDENLAVAGGSGGLFIALLRDIAAGMSARRHDIEDMLADLRARLPDNMPELDEFLMAAQVNIEKRQPIVEQLRTLGRVMRDQLNNRIDDVAQKAELKVVAITSGVVVPSLLIGSAARPSSGSWGRSEPEDFGTLRTHEHGSPLDCDQMRG
jgi:Flp pilus assembly protein TadB